MKNFFIMTRGRTGSTAIIDSLNKSKNIVSAQELFIKLPYKKHQDEEYYTSTPRFDVWSESKGYHFKIFQRFLGQSFIIRKYLAQIEKINANNKTIAFGFKVLSHHFEERPMLKYILQKRAYKVVYLTRNIPRQVISGMVAKQRGKYNAHDRENYRDDAIYKIDIDEFKSLVAWETQEVANDISMLESSGFRFIQVRYEDFIETSDIFFAKIFSFLEIPEEKLPKSSFSIMIKDPKHVIQNYNEVEQCLSEMGMAIS
ncbi:sulfotransferase [uncultured Porticoccus sp.]|jgi:LPS sulfotransferase NodH|uniref:sulfotransferase n=1 Tax=uncultured Porticoccus sp. TaxID=1256050 RepID=UPI0030D6FE04|tara:strand:- start:565 stop:1335 length:771 start_codon:yes stop_codon:yes gene_type:complete